MAVTGQEIRDIVAGDNGGLRRSFTISPTTLSLTFAKVYLTVKERRKDPDAIAILQKFITTTLGANGQITKANTGLDHLIEFYFLLTKVETALMQPGKAYWYDFQGITDVGEVYTFETESKIIMLQGETDAST